MPTPTQQDIDRLRAVQGDPNKVAKFESYFGVKADDYLAGQFKKPTEQDIARLQQVKDDPVKVGKFEAVFGPSAKYLTQNADLQPSMQPKTRLQRMLDDEKDQTTLQRLSPLEGLGRLGAGILDTGDAIFNKDNIKKSIQAVGDTVSDIPDALSNPGEFGRGLYQGALQAPAALNDLALMGVDKAAQIGLGNQPLPPGSQHPLGVATARDMYSDWGNKLSQAAGGVDAFDFNEPATPGGKLARHAGEFTGGGMVLGAAGAPEATTASALSSAAKTVIPSVGATIGAESAQKVAPNEPGWQVLAGAAGAFAPGLLARSVRGGVNAAQAIPDAAVAAGDAVAKPFTDKGRENVVGNALLEAAGNRVPDALDQPAVPGLAPTLGQVTNNEGLLALEKSLAKSQEGVLPFKERLQENQAVARNAVTNMRGSGSPDDVRTVADRAMQIADENAAGAERSASSGLSEDQSADLARGRISAARERMRTARQGLWHSPDLMSEDALVNVDDLRSQLGDFMSSRSKVQGQAIPKEIEDKLFQMNPREPLKEIQAVRSEFGDSARDYAAQGNSKMADIYGGMRDVVGRFLDSQEFDNPRTQEAYQAARNISRLEAQLYKQPTEMKQVLARTPTGGDVVSPGRTLEKFVRPGPAGRDTIRQVLNVDSSPEMINILGDYIVSKLPRGTQAAQDYMRKFSPTLEQLPGVRARLQSVVDARVAADALRRSPISIFAGKEPRAAVKQLMASPDRIAAVRRLRQYLSRTPHAWDGLKAAFVDEILHQIDSTMETGATGNPALKQGATMKFYRENADIIREILGPVGEDTMRGVASAIEQITRTSRAGYPGGSDTFPLLSGNRFIDQVVARYLKADGESAYPSMVAGYSLGHMFGGPAAGVAGVYGGARMHALFADARAQTTALLHEAMLDPAKGRALMMQASQESLRAMPRPMRQQLKGYVAKKQGERAAATNAVVHPPEGFKKHKDGKWYGPDPQKPGAYQEWSPNPFK